MKIARRFLISGRVQGVGFRWFAQNAAIREGTVGWVTNLDDGRVEVFVEGDEDSVVRVERALRSGPPGGRVDHVSVVDDQPGNMKSFRIR